MEAAPFYGDVCGAPPGGQVFWRRASDGVRLRIGAWPRGDKGSVLLFTGRTEYIEKYGDTARDLAEMGYGMITLDWRGQGLSDRLLKDRAVGHVHRFTDFQHDVAALMVAAQELEMPRPYYLVSHSMGGAIALRALINGLEVQAAVFSAPMWGLLLSPLVRPIAWTLATASGWFGLRHLYAPGTGPVTYVAAAPFENNLLTTDPERYAMMQHQVATHPDLALAGPSLGWLHESLHEIRVLRALPSPEVPTLTFLGTHERIVDTKAVVARMQDWPDGRLEMIPGSEHEVLMEKPATRAHAYALMDKLFQANATTPDPG